MVTLAVPFTVLLEIKGKWDESGDELDGQWRRLHKTSTDGLATDVAAAVETFRETWVDELKAMAGQAQDHSEEIVFFRGVVQLADEAQAERVRSLLPWAYRAAEIR